MEWRDFESTPTDFCSSNFRMTEEATTQRNNFPVRGIVQEPQELLIGFYLAVNCQNLSKFMRHMMLIITIELPDTYVYIMHLQSPTYIPVQSRLGLMDRQTDRQTHRHACMHAFLHSCIHPVIHPYLHVCVKTDRFGYCRWIDIWMH